jgi:putative nucleotidyltransferase with HDIG domain
VRPKTAAELLALERRILFVGAEADWFHQVEQEMPGLQPGWTCLSAVEAAMAETLLGSAPFDFLVLESRSPIAANLWERREKFSKQTICVVRCDLSDRLRVTQWQQAGATPVSEDGSTASLVAGLKRAERLREWMSVPAIKKLLPMIRKLPAEPKLYSQVSEELQSPMGSMNVVANLISQDPIMSAKILQVTNSAFFGRAEVTDISEAVMVLGSERVRSLVLLAGVFSQYSGSVCPGFSAEPIWSHSLQVGFFARAIAQGETQNMRLGDTAFTAGLLHDIGKLILAANVPEMFEAVLRTQKNGKMSQREAELVVMGTTHAEVGACLLATWGLPQPILEAIAWHHEPERSTEKGFSLLAAVHVANAFSQEVGFGSEPGVRSRIHVEYLKEIGVGDSRERWRQFCELPTPEANPPNENENQP